MRALVIGLLASLLSACGTVPAALPMRDAVPPDEPLPIDGVWRLDSNGIRYRIQAGRVLAFESYPFGPFLISPDMVVTRAIVQDTPRQYTGWDLVAAGPWVGRVRDDGKIALTLSNALLTTDHVLTPLRLDHQAWFDAQLAADRVLPVPQNVRVSTPRPPAPAAPAPSSSPSFVQPAAAPVPPAASGAPGDLGRYHALVIGNNGYRDLPDLRTARSDANAVGDLLRGRYGFEVDTLLDATRRDTILALDRLRKQLDESDNLLIYYAGHGWLDEAADEGYWLPVDADPNTRLNWISHSSIAAFFRAVRAKHVLVVADSCYAGKLTRGLKISVDGQRPDYFQQMARKKARVVISAGGLEPVQDGGPDPNHSVFASAFLKVLRENGALLDTTTLFSKIRRPVVLASDQTPELAEIRKAGHEGGDFLFAPR